MVSIVDFASEVQPSDIKAVIETQLTDSAIQDIIDHAANLFIEPYLESVGHDPDDISTDDGGFGLLKSATILWAQKLVFDRDASAFRKVSNLREGDIAMGMSGNSQRDRQALKEDSLMMLKLWLVNSGPKKPRLKMHRRLADENPFDTDA